jgi:hypothetical protein
MARSYGSRLAFRPLRRLSQRRCTPERRVENLRRRRFLVHKGHGRALVESCVVPQSLHSTGIYVGGSDATGPSRHCCQAQSCRNAGARLQRRSSRQGKAGGGLRWDGLCFGECLPISTRTAVLSRDRVLARSGQPPPPAVQFSRHFRFTCAALPGVRGVQFAALRCEARRTDERTPRD